MLRQVFGELFGILNCFVAIYFEVRADAAFHNFFERGGAVGSLPQNGCSRVQGKLGRIVAGHDQHFFPQHAGGDSRTACDV